MDGWKKAGSLSLRVVYPYIIYVCITAIVSIIMEQAGYTEQTGGENRIGTICVSAGITSLILYGIYQKEHISYNMPKKKSIKKFMLAVFLSASTCLLLNLLLLTEVSGETSKEIYMSSFAMQILTAGIVVPIAEELIFRGLGYFRLRETLGFFAAAFLSALAFGLYHGNLLQGTYAAVMGFLFAWLAEQEKGIFLPIAGHMSANLLSLFMTESGAAFWLMETTARRNTGIVLSASAVLLCFMIIRQENAGRKTTKK